jgi:hypothetical protein
MLAPATAELALAGLLGEDSPAAAAFAPTRFVEAAAV